MLTEREEQHELGTSCESSETEGVDEGQGCRAYPGAFKCKCE